MQKLSWILNVVLLAVIGVMVYIFLIVGSVEKSEDGRTAILLNESERLHVLGDMRKFLEHTRDMVEALGDNDMEAFATAASGVGLINEPPPPTALVAKLPLEFMTLGLDTHSAFDDLSTLARENGDTQVVAAKLGEIMNNCTTCHEIYRLKVEEE